MSNHTFQVKENFYLDEYSIAIHQPQQFWLEKAKAIDWFISPKTGYQDGFWFHDGMLNMSWLALDYNVNHGRAHQVALIYDSPVTQTVEKYTFKDLLQRVEKFAGGLLSLGIVKNDTVIIYMPMIPDAVIAMLACARIGVVHSVVFGGFAPHELAIRINNATPKAIITASCGIEIDKIIPYQPLVDKAIQEASHKPDYIIIKQRDVLKTELKSDAEIDMDVLLQSSAPAPCISLPANHPLYILYTSGTTGVPKGIVRDTGGYAAALKYSMQAVYNCQPGEVFWAASDVGWVVGHSYIVYAPLINGNTTVLYEGKPIKTPDAGAFWRVIEQHGVNILFTAPTAIRAIKKEDSNAQLLPKYNIQSLKHLFLAGERCDPPTYHWIKMMLNIPVIDHWWQTESGWPMAAIPLGLENFPVKPGSSGKSVPGFEIKILDEEGNTLQHDKEGFVCVKLPLPPGCLTSLWNNEIRFKQSYLSKFPGYYFTGDGGYIDEDNYVFIMGRVDDVINVAGHRLSTGEMEEIVSAHPAIAECAVVGIADAIKGEIPIGLAVLKDNVHADPNLIQHELAELIREKIGPIACYKNTLLVKRLPKTRSGKILRKNIRMIANAEVFTMPSTIDDPTILDEIREQFIIAKIGNLFQKSY
jgi:acyl-coenzyme A synthetase/AMP-(fatty) acid ligase